MRKFTSEEIDEKAQDLVKYHVTMCATWLMDALREYSENHPDDAIFDIDEYYTGLGDRCPECLSANISEVWDYRQEHPEWDPDKKVNDEYICENCKETFREPRTVEIYEYWFVDDWFANKLQEKGEFVLETIWAPIWGRHTTGQAIYIDGVIQEIAKDILEEIESWKTPTTK